MIEMSQPGTKVMEHANIAPAAHTNCEIGWNLAGRLLSANFFDTSNTANLIAPLMPSKNYATDVKVNSVVNSKLNLVPIPATTYGPTPE